MENEMFTISITEGSLGVNLQSARNTGAYIESFYRKKDGGLLPAEESHVLCIGDRIYSINGEFVEFLKLNEIHKFISGSNYPIEVKFKRPQVNRSLSLLCLIRDPHNFTFIDQFLAKYEKTTPHNGDTNNTYSFDTACKILLLNMIDLVLLHTSELPPSQNHIKCKLLDDCYHSDFKFHIDRLIPKAYGGQLLVDIDLDALITSGQVDGSSESTIINVTITVITTTSIATIATIYATIIYTILIFSQIVENEKSSEVSETRLTANGLPASPTTFSVKLEWLVDRVGGLSDWLQADLDNSFMPVFLESDAAARMLGYRARGRFHTIYHAITYSHHLPTIPTSSCLLTFNLRTLTVALNLNSKPSTLHSYASLPCFLTPFLISHPAHFLTLTPYYSFLTRA